MPLPRRRLSRTSSERRRPGASQVCRRQGWSSARVKPSARHRRGRWLPVLRSYSARVPLVFRLYSACTPGQDSGSFWGFAALKPKGILHLLGQKKDEARHPSEPRPQPNPAWLYVHHPCPVTSSVVIHCPSAGHGCETCRATFAQASGVCATPGSFVFAIGGFPSKLAVWTTRFLRRRTGRATSRRPT